MNKNYTILLATLFLIPHNYINSSEQELSLKNLSLFYAGTGLGLWTIAHIAAKLSGAVPVYFETRGKNVIHPGIDYWEPRDETESTIKKGLIKVANSFLKAGRIVSSPVTTGTYVSLMSILGLIDLLEGAMADISDIAAGKRSGEPWIISYRIKRAKDDFNYFFKHPVPFLSVPSILPIIAGFGGPLLLQKLYDAMKKNEEDNRAK